ncbi:MAG: tetratricopeptide repeat protein [Steroidobacteraceae bacterium]
MLYLILPYALSIALIIHCIKTGRNWIWVWVMLFLPLLGALAYAAVELLPELFGSRTAQRTGRGLKRAMDPYGDLRRFEQEAAVTGNVASRQRYAEELVRHGRCAEAITQYRQTLSGLYEHDPNLMLGLARAQFGNGEASAARSTLETLMQHNPQFDSPERRLLFARSLEQEGNLERALEEYGALAPAYPGAEAAVRYAQLLERQGERETARKVARELLERARIAPAHYRRAQRTWLDAASRLL